jgi:hypothetical protein
VNTQTDLTAIIERIERGHGLVGRDLERVTLRLSAGGPAFAMKGQRTAFDDVEASVTVAPQRVRFVGPDWHAEWAAPELVAGYRRLAHGRRRLRWDRTDAAAFGAAALWTYVSLPTLLTSRRVHARSAGTVQRKGQTWDRLDLEFDDDVATHSQRQAVYVDSDGLIRRHDYTARAFGSWVTSAHILDDYREFDGFRIATRRHVHPRVGRRALRRPTVVRISVREAEFATREPVGERPLRARRRG